MGAGVPSASGAPRALHAKGFVMANPQLLMSTDGRHSRQQPPKCPETPPASTVRRGTSACSAQAPPSTEARTALRHPARASGAPCEGVFPKTWESRDVFPHHGDPHAGPDCLPGELPPPRSGRRPMDASVYAFMGLSIRGDNVTTF